MTIFVKKKLTFILINLDNSLNMVNFFLKRKIKCVAVLLGYDTNKAFCKYLGISESFLSLLINGHRTISRKKMSQIIEKTKNCGKYAITLDDFFPNMCEDNDNCNNKIKKVKNNKDTVSPACEDNGDIVCNTLA